MGRRKRDTLNDLSTFADQRASPLLSLAAELRNRIFEYALVDLEVEIPRRSCVNRRGGKCYGSLVVPGFLCACKQTYHETVNLFYATATFSVWDSRYYSDGTLSRLPDWLARIGPLRTQLISEFRVYTQFEGFNVYERFVEFPSGFVEAESTTRARVARSALARTRHAVRHYCLRPGVLKVNVGSPRHGVWTSRPMSVEQGLGLRAGQRSVEGGEQEEMTRDLDSQDWDRYYFEPTQWTFCVWSPTNFQRSARREKTARRTR